MSSPEPCAAPERLGFVGLGNLGRHLAASLLRAGFPLTVHVYQWAYPTKVPPTSGVLAEATLRMVEAEMATMLGPEFAEPEQAEAIRTEGGARHAER